MWSTAALAQLLREKEEVLDVGSGGGVPGVLLAILRPDLDLSLCDSTQKKARVLTSIVAELGLKVPVHQCRAEHLLEDIRFDSLVARAVGPLWKILQWFEPHWASIGRLLLIKGPKWVDERAEARRARPAQANRTAEGGGVSAGKHLLGKRRSAVEPPSRRLRASPLEGSVMSSYSLTHLKQLEAESIHIIREVAAEFQNPVMLYSIGKDSSVMVQLALKAFFPARPPFPLMHIDTTWKFREMIAFRESYVRHQLGLELLVHVNEEGRQLGLHPLENSEKHTEVMKTDALEAGAGQVPVRCGVWRCTAGRGEIAGERTGLFVPQPDPRLGPEEPAA